MLGHFGKGNRTAHILKFLDYGAGQRFEFGVFRLAAAAANARQIKNFIQRFRDIGDGLAHLGALSVVLDRFHAHSECGERRFQVMANRTQHDIFFVQHGRNARFHTVMRAGQCGNITGAARH